MRSSLSSCLSSRVVGLYPVAVITVQNILYPRPIVKIPQNGFSQAFLKCMCGMPVELRGQFCTVDRIAEIMSGTNSHKFDEVGVRAFTRRAHRIEYVADTGNDLKVGTFRSSADVVSLPHSAYFKHTLDSGTMILHMEPVVDIGAVSICGKSLWVRALSVTSGISFQGTGAGHSYPSS